MAVILVLVCGVLGFSSAVAALFLFDASLLQAFTLWMVGGFVAMFLSLLPALLPVRAPREAACTEAA